MARIATDKQIAFIKNLYRDIGQTPEEIENLSTQEASKLIKELKEMKKKLEPHDDGKYWY